MKKHLVLCIALAAGLALASGAAAGSDTSKAAPDHIQLTADELQWMDAPPVLPPGAKIAVLMGDPSKEGYFIVRLKMPADYTVPPHWHPTTESFTVLKGQLYLGTGDTVDKSKATPVPTHGFASLPPMHHHYVYTDEETVIDLSAYGPFQIHYVNPEDNPAKQSGMKH